MNQTKENKKKPPIDFTALTLQNIEHHGDQNYLPHEKWMVKNSITFFNL